MASSSTFFSIFIPIFSTLLLSLFCISYANLSPSFYDTTCPELSGIVHESMASVIQSDPRMGASLLRLFFHDCFVNGCDASILLDDTATFTGEKNAGPNANSARGFEVIDIIKTRVEAACPGIVSCADILALATREGVVLLRGPTWNLPFGRRDSLTASQSAANNQLPGPSSSLATLTSMFASKGLSMADLTVLSGAHTIGQAGCENFRDHVYKDEEIDADFANNLKGVCPRTGGNRNIAPLDVLSATRFDNSYYQNLVARRGLLHSDQELFKNSSRSQELVRVYSLDGARFAADFGAAMVKLGGVGVLSGSQGQVRRNCRVVN